MLSQPKPEQPPSNPSDEVEFQDHLFMNYYSSRVKRAGSRLDEFDLQSGTMTRGELFEKDLSGNYVQTYTQTAWKKWKEKA